MTNQLIIDLESMSPSGECVARHEGMVLFVAMGIPGERVEVEVVHRRKTWGRARIRRILTPSSRRVAPPCPHFGHCGGCEWQHIDYNAQVEYKAGIVREQLARIGGISDATVRPCIASPGDYGYRNRIQLIASSQSKAGYRARQSHEVVEIDQCPIADENLNAMLPETRAIAGEMIDLRAHDGGVSRSADHDSVHITVGRHTYRAGSAAFFQVNTPVAALLVDEVMRALDLQGKEHVLDLYCGVGLFTLPISLKAAHVTGVELSKEACADAIFNVRDAGDKARILALDVNDALGKPELQQAQWDAVVLDPPRAGVDHSALIKLIAQQAPKIVYVSCDPATLARDAKILCAQGYGLRFAQPMDMFPQTHHVETVAVFDKQTS